MPPTWADLPSPDDHLLVDTVKGLVEKVNCPRILWEVTDEAWRVLEKVWGKEGTFTLFSGLSDCGLHLQDFAHPNDDLYKTAIYGIDWAKVSSQRESYLKVPIGPACRVDYCCSQDRYIARMERHGWWTIDEKPDNLVWYSANLCMEEPDFHWLPFGVNSDGNGKDILGGLSERVRAGKVAKKGLLYLNFQPHTAERLEVRRAFKGLPWVTFRENVPVEQYLGEMAEHHFVLSPPGNGLDCYRNYEAFYLGVIPVLRASPFTSHLFAQGLPAIAVSDWLSLTEQGLQNVREQAEGGQLVRDYASVKKSTWASLIEELANV